VAELENPGIQTEMLVRRPAAEVFQAFVNPDITTRFWFTRSSGRLEAGKHVQWDWEMFGASASVDVKAVDQNQRILFEWGAPGSRTVVRFDFATRGESSTLVSLSVTGFAGDDSEVVRQMVDAMGGFSLVLAGAKAVLEHDINLNLVADRHPDRRPG
jgi:uncharacterized protein YndB with AHSA1/START domain